MSRELVCVGDGGSAFGVRHAAIVAGLDGDVRGAGAVLQGAGTATQDDARRLARGQRPRRPGGSARAACRGAGLPVVLAPGIGLGAWIMGVVLIPCAVAFVEAAGALAVTTADRHLARCALKAALGIVGLLADAAALGSPAWLGGPATLGLPLAALALLIGGACCLARAADRLPRLNMSA